MLAELNKIAEDLGVQPLSETPQPTVRQLNNLVSKLETELGLTYEGSTLRVLDRRVDAIVSTVHSPCEHLPHDESDDEEIL